MKQIKDLAALMNPFQLSLHTTGHVSRVIGPFYAHAEVGYATDGVCA
jgi:hypothetical protein